MGKNNYALLITNDEWRHRGFYFFMALVSLLFFAPVSFAAAPVLPWDNTEKGLFAGIVAANAIDCWQTHILTVNRADEGFYEANGYTQKLCGDRVAWYESAAMKTAIVAPLVYFGCHKWAGDHRIRKLMLMCLLAVALEPVIRNEDVGGGVVFKF